MTEQELAPFRKALLDEKAHLEEERSKYVNDDRADSEEDEAGELSHSDPNDPADEATNLFDRERDMAFVDNYKRLLAKIDRALVKIDEGTYGLSDVDGTPIPKERLEAIPYAVTTVAQEEDIV